MASLCEYRGKLYYGALRPPPPPSLYHYFPVIFMFMYRTKSANNLSLGGNEQTNKIALFKERVSQLDFSYFNKLFSSINGPVA